MEEKVEKPAETSEKPTVEHTAAKKDPFSLIGKIAVGVVILALLTGGGIYLGMTLNKDKNQTNSPTPYVSQTPTGYTNQNNTNEATPTTAKTQTKIVTAGMDSGASSFKPYTIEVPEGWTESQDKTDISNKLTLTNGAYSLSIYQAPIGGGGCLYPGDADVMMAQRFTQYVGIDGENNTNFRRSWNTTGNPAGKIGYTYCQYGTDAFGAPTSFGAISATSPDPSEKDTMIDMDTMVASLKKI